MESTPPTDDFNGVPRATWERLYELADRVGRLAPWEWLGAGDLFGVVVPGRSEPWLVSFVGGQGNTSCACLACPDWTSLRDLQALRAHGATVSGEALLEIPHLQVVFTGRALVSDSERALLRALGRRCRGPRAWTVFRSFQPGYLPWLPDAAEAGALAVILHQTLGMALRAEEEPGLLRSRDGAFLVRLPPASGVGAWSEVWRDVPEGELEASYRVRNETLDAVRRAPLADAAQEVELALSPGCLQMGRAGRPQLLYVLALVDTETGQAEHVDLLQALEGARAMWHEVPGRLVEAWSRKGGCPREVRVRSDRMMNLLRPLTERIPFRLVRCAELPRVDRFLVGMARYLKTARLA